MALATPTAVTTTFTAAAGQSYSFSLTVKNTDGLSASATTSVSTAIADAASITQFTANPAAIQPGQSSTLTWACRTRPRLTISPGPGSVDPRTGSVSVSPDADHDLHPDGDRGHRQRRPLRVTVTVGAAAAGNPQIVRFEANPLTIAPGGQSTLSWTTTGATTVSISGVGTVNQRQHHGVAGSDHHLHPDGYQRPTASR